jgi:tetratricopeptide (TPR) repeat protein
MIANAIESLRERHMRRKLQPAAHSGSLAILVVAAFALLLAAALPVAAQDQQPQPPAQAPGSQPPAQPPAADSKGAIPPDGKQSDAKQTDAKPAPPKQSNSLPMPGTEDKSTYDPFHAQQDVEVGEFYLHRGDIDGAIARFEDAIRLRDNFAQPRLLLAECYEKKHQTAKALKYYREYLKVFPDAPDRKKVEKKIEKLSS